MGRGVGRSSCNFASQIICFTLPELLFTSTFKTFENSCFLSDVLYRKLNSIFIAVCTLWFSSYDMWLVESFKKFPGTSTRIRRSRNKATSSVETSGNLSPEGRPSYHSITQILSNNAMRTTNLALHILAWSRKKYRFLSIFCRIHSSWLLWMLPRTKLNNLNQSLLVYARQWI